MQARRKGTVQKLHCQRYQQAYILEKNLFEMKPGDIDTSFFRKHLNIQRGKISYKVFNNKKECVFIVTTLVEMGPTSNQNLVIWPSPNLCFPALEFSVLTSWVKCTNFGTGISQTTAGLKFIQNWGSVSSVYPLSLCKASVLAQYVY